MSKIKKGLKVTLSDGTVAQVVKFAIATQTVTCSLSNPTVEGQTWERSFSAEDFRTLLALQSKRAQTIAEAKEDTVAGYPKKYRMRNQEQGQVTNVTADEVTLESASGMKHTLKVEQWKKLWEERHFISA